jgi:hypothetical protein
MTNEEKLIDEFITQQLMILRLSAGETKDAMLRLDQMQAELVAKLAGQNLPDLSQSKTDKVISAGEDIIAAAYVEQAAVADLLGIAEHVADDAGRALDSVLTIALGGDSAVVPPASYLDAVASDVIIQGAPQSAWWSAQSDDTAFKFAAQVRQGLINGETNQQIINRLVGTVDVPGIMETARRNAASLVQTSVQSVANAARLAVFQKNADVLSGLRQISTLDSHTSLTCVAYSDAEWDLEGNPINGNDLPFNGGCPRHFNCRSVIVGVPKTFKEMGLDIPEPEPSPRTSSSGPISGKTTFNDYLNRMGKDFQDKVLGKGRAQLWRDGKITLRDLVSGEGNPLTLAELRAKTAR